MSSEPTAAGASPSEPTSERSIGLPALEGDGDRHASWLELFFDLCFVAAVALLSASLHEAHSPAGIVTFAALFVPIWWAWTAYTWYTTAFDTDDAPFRLGMLTAMLAAIGVAAGLEGWLTDDWASDTFVAAYAVLLGVLVALFVRAHRRFPQARALTGRYIAGDAAGAVLWLLSLAFDEPVRPWIWALAMLVLLVTPLLATRAVDHQVFDPEHIPERYGLFTMIVLGESVVFTVEGLETGSDLAAVLAALLGFVLAASIWSVYFGRLSPIPGRERLRRTFAWVYSHLLVFGGIAAAAVGVEFAVESEARGGGVDIVDRLTLGGGVVSFLVGVALVHGVTHGLDRVVIMRVGSAAVVLAFSALAEALAPLPFVAAIAGVVLAVAIWEAMRARTSPGELPALPG